tara:strand:- start:47922 stop:48683 length:762 start_codon:yes stop_codon:yes gene_type:complete
MLRPSVLITRPKEDADHLASAIHTLGANPLIMPMLNINYLEGSAPNFVGVGGILFTSSNGVRALSLRLPSEHSAFSIPIFAVGEATAEKARENGFSNIFVGNGDVKALISCVKSNLSPQTCELVHIAGVDVAGNLSRELGTLGFKIRTEVLYEAEPVKIIDYQLLNKIKSGKVDCILFFSTRTIKTFASLIESVDCSRSMVTIDAVCLSDTIAREAEILPWRQVVVCEQPTQQSLLTALRNLVAGRINEYPRV